MAKRPPISYASRYTLSLPEMGVAYLAEADVYLRPVHPRHAHREVQVLWVLAGAMGLETDAGVRRLPVGGACAVPANAVHAVVAPAGRARVARVIDLRLTDDPSNPLLRFLAGLGDGPAYRADAPAVERAAALLRDAVAAAGPARAAGAMSAVWALLATLQPQVHNSAPPRPTTEGPTAAGSTTGGVATDAMTSGAAMIGGSTTDISASRSSTSGPMPAAGASDVPAAGRPADAPGPPPAVDPRVARADAFMRHQLSSAASVDDVAAAVGLSRSQLTRLYLAARRVGPAGRLRELRVDQARHLLATTTLSVKEIARACGFARPNHFGRVFERQTGTTPTAFRAGGNPDRRLQAPNESQANADRNITTVTARIATDGPRHAP